MARGVVRPTMVAPTHTGVIVLTSPGRALRAVTIAAALALAAGCTSDDPSATPSSSAGTTSETAPSPSTSDELPATGELFRAARTAALAAESARIEGSLERQGKAIEVEVEGTAGGSNQELFLVVDGGGRAEVLTVGDEYWLGGDEAFWVEQTGDAEAGKAMVGRYVPIAESDAKELGSFTVRSILTEEFSDPAIAAIETSSEPVQRRSSTANRSTSSGPTGPEPGGRRRQRHPPAARGSDGLTGRPRCHPVGASGHLHRAPGLRGRRQS